MALDSHRLALTIDQDNADLLLYVSTSCTVGLLLKSCSNTAQVLTSLAEDVSEGRTSSQSSKDEGLNHFQEVLELLQRCLNVQEFKFTQAQENAAQESETHIDPGDRDHSARSSSASDVSEEEVWASVEEPVTKDTLIDTALAQMDTLTAICGLGSFNSGLAWIEEYYRTTLQDKITLYLEGTGRYHEAALAKANFISALSDAAFRSGRLDLATYETELNVAFSHQDLNLSADPRGLCDKADAELAFNASIQASIQQAQTKELIQVGSICWKHITKALDSLTAASKIPDAQNLAQIHLRRGDCELWRLRLGEAPLKYELTIKSVPTLLKNAEVYYRGAAALGSRSGGAKDEQKEAEVKEVIAAGLAGATQRFLSLLALEKDAVESVVEDMKDEGLLGPESLKSIGRVFG